MEDKKRSREEIETFEAEAKRFRADIILEILDSDDDDDADSGDRNGPSGDADSDDLASVMKSLEDEIALPPPPPQQLPSELGYLLEASDDELGLPPATTSSASSSEEEDEDASGAGEAEAGDLGFGGQIWGFEDEIISGCYDEFGFGEVSCYDHCSGSVGEDDAVAFDDGLFYGDDVAVFGLSDLTWPAESMPTV